MKFNLNPFKNKNSTENNQQEQIVTERSKSAEMNQILIPGSQLAIGDYVDLKVKVMDNGELRSSIGNLTQLSKNWSPTELAIKLQKGTSYGEVKVTTWSDIENDTTLIFEEKDNIGRTIEKPIDPNKSYVIWRKR